MNLRVDSEAVNVYLQFREKDHSVLHTKVHLDNLVKAGKSIGEDVYAVDISLEPAFKGSGRAFISLDTLVQWAKLITD